MHLLQSVCRQSHQIFVLAFVTAALVPTTGTQAGWHEQDGAPAMMHQTRTSQPAVTAADLDRAGLLELGNGCDIHPSAVFFPRDALGTLRPVVLGDRVVVGAHAVLHGGTRVAADTHLGHHTITGEPERGYALRNLYPGAGGVTTIGAGVELRSGGVVYAGVVIGDGATIGHHTLLRTGVRVGSASQLAANLTVERGVSMGDQVRCSPGSHLTADTVVADRVFIGAGVRTVNDKELIWRDPANELPLSPPTFARGCKVGSGAIILAGITIGEDALVGAGSVVTRDVPAGGVVYGVPARQHGRVNR